MVNQDAFDVTVATIASHLEKEAPDLVLHAASYFSVLAKQATTAVPCALNLSVMTGLISVLNPARVLPSECRIAAAQALNILTATGICADAGSATLRALPAFADALQRFRYWVTISVPAENALELAFCKQYLYVHCAGCA